MKRFTKWKRVLMKTQRLLNVRQRKKLPALYHFIHIISHKRQPLLWNITVELPQHKIGGRAKAMLVTRSRLHAVRYKHAYIKQKNYTDMKTLIAFSDTVDDEGIPYTEAEMNTFSENELPDKFSGSEYQVLIVAEKY